jgi:YD repeat-containing protein
MTLSAGATEPRAKGPGGAYDLILPPGFTAELVHYDKNAKLSCRHAVGGHNDSFEIHYAPSSEPLGAEQAKRLLANFQSDWKGWTLEKSEAFDAGAGLTGLYRELLNEKGYRGGLYWIRTPAGLMTVVMVTEPGRYAALHEEVATAVRTLHFDGPPADLAAAGSGYGLSDLRLPPGFSIEVYSNQVPGARSMALGPDGTLYVGTMGKAVYALPDAQHRHKPDRVVKLEDGLNMPNGVAMHGKDLYVAEVSRVFRLKDVGEHLDVPPQPEVIYDKFPKDRMHGWKFIRFGPDGKLYVPVGSPKNVVLCPDPYATITRMNPDGTGFEVFARGVRNTVGFDWDPSSRELWFTDNGRDLLGDDIPPDELDHAPKPGMHFGHPYRWGNNQSDPQFGSQAPAGLTFTPPVVEFQAHSATLGMRFYTGTMLPKSYRGKILICSHGSWNRTVPTGYQLWMVDPATKQHTVVIDGFLQGQQHWGRPVDVQQLDDGSLLISDDQAGAIYRLTYTPHGKISSPLSTAGRKERSTRW